VVVGGAEIGAATTRRLLQAVDAGRLSTNRIFVVDRDERCAASTIRDPRVELVAAEWSDWLDENLDALSPDDHFVPYHWAPHLLSDWLVGQVRRAGGSAKRGGDVPAHGVPVERPTGAGDRALSYATWVCPPTCIEPELCPHTRGPKDWSLARDLETLRPGEALAGRIVFRCLHLVWGVGTVPVAAIHEARDRLLGGLQRGRQDYLVATSSHCHALAAVLEVAPSPGLN
jgi:hypothetical protein